jgi:hypothetical protein
MHPAESARSGQSGSQPIGAQPSNAIGWVMCSRETSTRSTSGTRARSTSSGGGCMRLGRTHTDAHTHRQSKCVTQAPATPWPTGRTHPHPLSRHRLLPVPHPEHFVHSLTARGRTRTRGEFHQKLACHRRTPGLGLLPPVPGSPHAKTNMSESSDRTELSAGMEVRSTMTTLTVYGDQHIHTDTQTHTGTHNTHGPA